MPLRHWENNIHVSLLLAVSETKIINSSTWHLTFISWNLHVYKSFIIRKYITWENYMFEKNLSFCCKNCSTKSLKFGGAWQTLSAMLRQIVNDFILSAMLLHQWRHISSIIVTTGLSNALLCLLAECRLDDVTLIWMCCHSCFNDGSMTSFV